MNPIAKLLITIGIVLILFGLFWQVGGKFLHLGRLPGDIAIERKNFHFYFPIVTCILISIALSLISYLIQYFKK